MAKNRHLSRIIAMQTLYEKDFRPDESLEEILERNLSLFPEDLDTDFIKKIVYGIPEHQKEIDVLILKAAPDWPIEQVAAVDKAILRLSIYELLFWDEVPPKVAIDEAVELGKQYGGINTSKFVNGVLGTIYRNSPKYSPEEEKENTGKKDG